MILQETYDNMKKFKTEEHGFKTLNRRERLAKFHEFAQEFNQLKWDLWAETLAFWEFFSVVELYLKERDEIYLEQLEELVQKYYKQIDDNMGHKYER